MCLFFVFSLEKKHFFEATSKTRLLNHRNPNLANSQGWEANILSFTRYALGFPLSQWLRASEPVLCYSHVGPESRYGCNGDGVEWNAGNFVTRPQIRRRIALPGVVPLSPKPAFLDIPSHMCHSMFPLGWKSITLKIPSLGLFILSSTNTFSFWGTITWDTERAHMSFSRPYV